MSEEKTHSQMRQEFYKTFNTTILPTVRRFEEDRKKTLKEANNLTIIVSLCVIILTFIVIKTNALGINTGQVNGFQIFLLMNFCFAIPIAWHCKIRPFEQKIKAKIMPHICACLCNIKWSNGSYGYGNTFKTSKVIPNFTTEYFDDIFKGIYKDVKFDIVESSFEIGSGKNRRTTFRGVVVKLNMNKNFHSHTIITPANFNSNAFEPKLERTILEDVEFEKKYNVYTNDPVDARYLITPTFMTRLNNIKTAFQANSIRCAFYQNQFFIAIGTCKNLFEFGSIKKPLDSAQQYFTAFNEIFSILTLIDYFKLDKKIGL